MPVTRSQFRESTVVRNILTADRVKLGQLRSDLTLIEVRNLSLPKGKTDSAAAVLTYEYKVEYPLSEPKGQELGKVNIKGEIIYIDTPKIIDDILKDWQKDKKIKPAVIQEVLNVALKDSQVEAIEQAKKVGLPSPVPLPRIKTRVGKGGGSAS